MKLSNIVVSLAIVVIVSTAFLLVIGDGVTKYNPSSIDENYRESFSNLESMKNNLTEITKRANDELDSSKNYNQGILGNILDFVFGGAYKASLIIGEVLNINSIMANEALKSIGFAEISGIIGIMVVALLLVFTLLYALHTVTKNDWD